MPYVQFRSSISTAELRSATYNGVEHIVCPVVGLVGDIVIHSAAAKDPEYVPLDVLSIAPEGWNNRPCVPDHPKNNKGNYTSANFPEILESRKFGQIFNSRIEDGKLKFDAYLSRSEAEKVGEEALDIIKRLENKEVVEVSTGAFVTLSNDGGIDPISGKEYKSTWSSIIPDHLAFLNSKSEGACNVEMGCGAPRVNEKSKLSVNKGEIIMEEEKPRMNFLQKILSKLKFNEIFDDGESDQELRNSISKALREIEPGFDWILDIYTETKVVIYSTYNYSNSKMRWHRRTYNLAENGVVTVNDDRVSVQPVTKYELVVEEAKSDENAEKSNKNDENNTKIGVNTTECSCKKGENTMAFDRETVINRLTSLAKGPFSTNKKALEAMDEAGLKALDESFPDNPPASDTSTGGTTETKKPVSKQIIKEDDKNDPLNKKEIADGGGDVMPQEEIEGESESEEKYLARAPQSIRDMVNRHKEAEAEYRDEMITALKSTQDTYSESELNKKPTSELEKLHALVSKSSGKSSVRSNSSSTSIRSYAGRGFPVDSSNSKGEDIYRKYPKPYDLALNKSKDNSKSTN